MADILGPSGQPLPPSNPLLSQQQGINAAPVSINTGSAQKAFSELQRVLDGMIKSFGGNFDKATNDSLKAQERFYRYVGDKDNERRLALKRYKDEAIAAINDETNAKIAGYEKEAQAGKFNADELKRKRVETADEAAKQIDNINKETARKASSYSGVGGAVRGVTSFIGGQIGGPIGGLISGVGNLITEPEVAIPAAILGAIIEISNKRAAFTRTGAQLAGAGFGLGSASSAQTRGSNFDLRLFSGLNAALSADEQRNIIAGMAGSRTMIDQARAANGMDAVRGNLGLFANILPDASKEMELFTDATKTLGMSQKDISSTFMSSRVNSERLKITQLDAIQTQLEMQKALRNITNDGTVAASVLFNVGGFLKGIGTSEAERQRMTLGIAQAGANLSLPQIAGMLSFTRGLGPNSQGMERAIFGTNGIGGMLGNKGTGVFGLMGEFFTKVGGQAKDPMQRLFIADALNKQFGLGLRTQDIPQFFNLSDKLRTGNMSEKEYSKQVEQLSRQAKAITIDGMDTLTSIVSPIKQMENMFTNFWTAFDAHMKQFFPWGGSGSSITPVSQSLPTQNVKKKANGGKHSSDFDVSVH